ncbi:WxL domain-containing protein [Lactiplantibacillus mudanjiangensis]|uniref:Cell surface protein [Lactobacillus paraplantarum] n=1 Tax=Lactiplantibacillus mudanjiangensis TaxID=1296538 RepID=A0A660EAM9_9LACO|nr:WxL domain-containing protein [Lactiplantibacillus mudanjiangensis]VDG20753.1 cell surface protein [Lactobacillus paraplantarum] [Lactiplantibacillus mudanjiangensis]VDG24445.1 cell surface protein [Lactobacillus paraplantarum] [Lactiplantibacillus mudanjiangensis]VDG30082.1 cell surface protein [Lactobacillus paraplantarum] [Lactiplantibacillus mudanjiangensis]
MRVTRMMTSIGGSFTLALLAFTPLIASAATGPGTSSSDNLTTASAGYAATTGSNAQAQSNAEFTVAPGALTLDQVPNIALGSVNVKDIVTGSPELPLVASNTTGGSGYDGNGNQDVSVTDYRGNHAGWTLTVGMGPFTSGPATVTGATLALDLTKNSTDNATTDAPVSLHLTQDTPSAGWISNPQTAWAVLSSSGEGRNTAFADTTSSLTIDKQATITAGTYDATLYWALQNAPVATPATTP